MAAKLRAFKTTYVSQNQLSIDGFDTPFGKDLDLNNRWVRLSKNIPWDQLVSIYHQKTKGEGSEKNYRKKAPIPAKLIQLKEGLVSGFYVTGNV
jgi:hypothetical protein